MQRSGGRTHQPPVRGPDGGRTHEAEDRHLSACANTLRWADEAAQAGDYDGALEWLAVLEAIGEDVPGSYREQRERWRIAGAQPGPANAASPAEV